MMLLHGNVIKIILEGNIDLLIITLEIYQSMGTIERQFH